MKRIISVFICLAMLLSFSSCNSSSKKTDDTAKDAPVEFSVTFLKNDWHGDPNNMEIFKELEKEANVKINWQVYPNATWNEKKNLMLNSGDIPDVFYMNAVNSNDIEKYGPQGLFVDLTQLIQKNAPNIQETFKKIPAFKALCTSPTDGKIYTISRAAERPANTLVGQMYVYKPWLDKLNLKIPTTSDEFYNMLKEFKTKDPNGNGKADELPYVFSNMENNYNFSELFGMFGYVYNGMSKNGTNFVNVNNKAIFVPTTQNYKNAIKYFNKMFQEGLFSKEDYATQDTKLLNSKLHSQEVTVGSFISFNYNIVGPADRAKDYVRVDIPMKGPSGDQVWALTGSKNNMGGTQFVMTNKAKNQDAIMKWLDAHFNKQTSIELFLGPEGTTLAKKDNMLTYIPTPQGKSYSEFRYANAPVHVPCVITADEWGKDIQVMDEDVERLDYMNKILKPFLKQSYIFSYPTADESKYVLSKGKDIYDFVTVTEARWMTEGGIDAEWDGFVSKLNSMGVDEYTKIMQNQIDRFNQNSK